VEFIDREIHRAGEFFFELVAFKEQANAIHPDFGRGRFHPGTI
jgi:hypothetical protein